jgi:regulator of CtrA degradation
MAAKNTEIELSQGDALRDVALEEFTASALFDRTFDEAMSLVEECARYLDGRGREESRVLPKKAALVYAGESMRVTTRLMQAASWLLVQRAVHEGDMKAEDAASERYRLGAREICLGRREEHLSELPAKLRELLERSESLYRRIARFDDIFFRNISDLPKHPVQRQLDRLEAAFRTQKP